MAGFKLGKMTLGSIFKKPETIQYPAQVKPAVPGLKGHIAVDADVCILCGICQKRCPTSAIAVDKKGARTWSIDRFLCVQCGSCARECPKHCLTMEPTYAPVATAKHVDAVEVPEHPKG